MIIKLEDSESINMIRDNIVIIGKVLMSCLIIPVYSLLSHTLYATPPHSLTSSPAT